MDQGYKIYDLVVALDQYKVALYIETLTRVSIFGKIAIFDTNFLLDAVIRFGWKNFSVLIKPQIGALRFRFSEFCHLTPRNYQKTVNVFILRRRDLIFGMWCPLS